MFGIGKAFKKGWKNSVGKITKPIRKGWDEIEDYAVPILAGAALGAATGGLGGLALAGTLGVSAGAAAGVGAAAVGSMGAMQGLQNASSTINQKKAADEAEQEAARQQILANSAITASEAPAESTSHAGTGSDSVASARKRRYSMNKTTRSSSLGLSRYASNTSRSTLG